MKNILVTGGAGFIGANFVRFLLEQSPGTHIGVAAGVAATGAPTAGGVRTIVNLDALTYAGSLENLKQLPSPERHTFVHGDICDRHLVDQLLHTHQIDTIVHFAAETHVDRSIQDPGPFIQTNIVGTYTLLEAARQYWLVEKAVPVGTARFHHVSTDEVFGTLQPGDPPFSETTPYAPNSPYAASKAASDHLVRAYFHTFGLPVTISNCSNNYGPYQFPEKLIPLMISNALEGKPLPVYGDGQQIRDWLFVGDHCAAIYQILDKGAVGETYNIGGNNQPTNLVLIETLCAILDEELPDSPYTPHKSLVQHVPDRPGHDRRYAMDITKISRELHWQPRQGLGGGLAQTIGWYLSNPEWSAAIRQQTDYQHWLEKNYAKRGDKQ